MPNFNHTAYYRPTNFTLENYFAYQAQSQNMLTLENNLKKNKQEIIDSLRETFRSISDAISVFSQLIKLDRLTPIDQEHFNFFAQNFHKILEDLDKVYDIFDTYSRTSSNDIIDLLAILEASTIKINALNDYLSNKIAFLKNIVGAENETRIIDICKLLLTKSSLINVQYARLQKGDSDLATSKISLDKHQPNFLCTINLKLAFNQAITLLENEAKSLNESDTQIFKYLLKVKQLPHESYYDQEEINGIFEKVNRENPEGNLNRLLHELQSISKSHQSNINLINPNKTIFNQETLNEVKTTLAEVSANPEKKYLYYLNLYLTNYQLFPQANEKQQKEFSNLVKFYKEMPAASQEKYQSELCHLQNETYRQFAKVYENLGTLGEIFLFLPLLNAMHNEAMHITSSFSITNEQTIHFELHQRTFAEYGKFAASGVIQHSSSLKKIDEVIQRLNTTENKELKRATISDKILWDAIAASNVPLTTKLTRDLITLHRYCVQKIQKNPAEELIEAQNNPINEFITELYKNILTIRLSGKPLHQQISEIKNKKKTIEEHYYPNKKQEETRPTTSIFENMISLLASSNQRTFESLFKDKRRLPTKEQEPDVSLFKKFKS